MIMCLFLVLINELSDKSILITLLPMKFHVNSFINNFPLNYCCFHSEVDF